MCNCNWISISVMSFFPSRKVSFTNVTLKLLEVILSKWINVTHITLKRFLSTVNKNMKIWSHKILSIMNWRNVNCQIFLLRTAVVTNVAFKWFLAIMNCQMLLLRTAVVTNGFWPSWTDIRGHWWLSFVRFKYKPGYRPCDLL